MKKLFLLLLCALLALGACSVLPNGPGGQPALTPDDLESGVVKGPLTADGFTLTGLQLNGFLELYGANDKARNDKPFSTEDVRCLFAQDELVTFRIAYGYSGDYAKLGVQLIPHGGAIGPVDPDGEAPLYYCEYELPYDTYPEPLEDEFSLDAALFPVGDYDLIITVNDTVVGAMKLAVAPVWD
ncbi:MAG: hypothetical protein II409_07215 [Clostridia bacterium]|nr:hypothetical protein [Clostridia bacterium]